MVYQRFTTAISGFITHHSIVIVIVSLLVGLLLIPVGSHANGSTASLKVVSPSVHASKGDDVSIDIVLDPGDSAVYGIQYRLIFDHGVVEVLSHEEADLIKRGDAETLEVINSIDNNAGSIDYGITRIKSESGVKDSGVVSRVVLKVIRDGDMNSYLNLTDVIIAGPHANEITSVCENGTLIVESVKIPKPDDLESSPAITPTTTETTGSHEDESDLEGHIEENEDKTPGFMFISGLIGIFVVFIFLRRSYT